MTRQPCIAIVEDDDDQRQNYVRALARMPVQVLAFADKNSALLALASQRPDLLILDIILGQEYDAGFNLYSQLSRQYPDLPVLFLTERVDEIDQVSGLRMGAWDYQPKPITIDYFVAKVESLLRLARNSSPNLEAREIACGNLSIDLDRRHIHWQQQPLAEFTMTEFTMLEYLVRRPGQVQSYQQLGQATFGGCVENNTISTHISNIKRKFKAVDVGFNNIISEYGQGYRWRN